MHPRDPECVCRGQFFDFSFLIRDMHYRPQNVLRCMLAFHVFEFSRCYFLVLRLRHGVGITAFCGLVFLLFYAPGFIFKIANGGIVFILCFLFSFLLFFPSMELQGKACLLRYVFGMHVSAIRSKTPSRLIG